MSVRITAAERDALYEQIAIRLSGIDDVWMAVEAEDFERAERVAREFTDYLRLVDDLGWAARGEPVELTTPPDILRRVCARLQGGAEAQREMEEEERAEARPREEQTQRVLETCRRVLGDLDGT